MVSVKVAEPEFEGQTKTRLGEWLHGCAVCIVCMLRVYRVAYYVVFVLCGVQCVLCVV